MMYMYLFQFILGIFHICHPDNHVEINSLITPYGQLKLTGSCSSRNNALQELHDTLVNTFGLQLYKDIVENDYGCYGPWYSITSFNGKQLVYPKLIQQNTHLDYLCKKRYKNFILVINASSVSTYHWRYYILLTFSISIGSMGPFYF